MFTPYAYLLDPVIRAAMKVDIKHAVLIFDEAHNIEDICRWALPAAPALSPDQSWRHGEVGGAVYRVARKTTTPSTWNAPTLTNRHGNYEGCCRLGMHACAPRSKVHDGRGALSTNMQGGGIRGAGAPHNAGRQGGAGPDGAHLGLK